MLNALRPLQTHTAITYWTELEVLQYLHSDINIKREWILDYYHISKIIILFVFHLVTYFMVLENNHKSLWMLSQQQPIPQPIFCSVIYKEKTLNYHRLDSIATYFSPNSCFWCYLCHLLMGQHLSKWRNRLTYPILNYTCQL